MSIKPTTESPGELVGGKEKAPAAIVTCGILRDEIEAVVQQQGLGYPVLYLAPAPCIDYDSLEKQLTVLLKRASELAEMVVVVIGKCHPEIDQILERHSASRLPMANCFEALLGPSRMRELLSETNTFFTTPSWLRHWRRAFKHGMKWDEVDVRQNFGLYERVLVLDAGVTPFSDEEVLEFFDYIQVPIEIFPIDLSHFTEIILAELAKLGVLSR